MSGQLAMVVAYYSGRRLTMMAHPVSLATVLLRHDLPDGSSHIDWMFAQDAEARRRLVTFRTTPRPDEIMHAGAVLAVERIGDHRPAYLEYEGPISGDRGNVARVARGQYRFADDRSWGSDDGEPLDVDVEWIGPSGVVKQRWRIFRQAATLLEHVSRASTSSFGSNDDSTSE